MSKESNQLNKRYFYNMWLLFLLMGIILSTVTFYNTGDFFISGAGLIFYAAASGCLLYCLYRALNRVKERLLVLSYEDQLTGIKNRRYFRLRIEEMIERYKRDGERFGIVFFDLDNFKRYNKQYGHVTGDKLLQKVTHVLEESTRVYEPLVRYGGDEFMLLLSGFNLIEAHDTAERIRQELEEKIIEVDGKQLFLQISGGVAACPDDGTELEELLGAVDRNLHRAKEKGNAICSSPQVAQQMMDPDLPLTINEKDSFLDDVGKQTTHLYLLAKSGDLEILKQTIVADKTFSLWGERGTFEFYYLLEGEIVCSEDGRVLTPGSMITLRSLAGEAYFKTRCACTLLYMTTTPTFTSQQKQIRELVSLNSEVERKDQQTSEHCIRMQQLSRSTGEKFNLKEEQLFALDFASFLHDIGKAEIPASILCKPEKLTKEEWELMKKHSEWGRDLILQHLTRVFFIKIAKIVYQHHERYDGKGYPQGLVADEILIEAQILAVVDSYDAMTTDRPYRKALSREEGLSEIKANTGSQFAPRVVEAFLVAEEEVNRNKCIG